MYLGSPSKLPIFAHGMGSLEGSVAYRAACGERCTGAALVAGMKVGHVGVYVFIYLGGGVGMRKTSRGKKTSPTVDGCERLLVFTLGNHHSWVSWVVRNGFRNHPQLKEKVKRGGRFGLV